MNTILKGGTIVLGEGTKKADILIDGEVIAKIAPHIVCKGAKEIDVNGKLIFPGFIDAHTHFDLEVCNTVTTDDFYTGTKAAIAGGTTMIIDFATQNKGETLVEALQNWHKKAEGKCACDYGFHMAISQWNSIVSQEVDVMVEEGITSFKLYMTYDAMYLADDDLYRALKRIKEIQGMVGIHCENKGIIDALVEVEKKKGQLSPKAHPDTRPAEVEAEAIHRILTIAALVDVPIMIVHLSSKEGYEEIRRARNKGQNIYVETCPQYLLLDKSVYQLPEYESRKYMIAPSLRTMEDQRVLWEAIGKGDIQTIATDHCSFTTEQKAMGKHDFTKIPCGMPGVENRPTLIYTYGVKEGKISVEQMCKLLSENPAKLYGVYPRKGRIAVGSDADLVIWNEKIKKVLAVKSQVANVDYHPYEGVQVQGEAEMVFLRGSLVVVKGNVIKEGKGEYVKRGVRASI